MRLAIIVFVTVASYCYGQEIPSVPHVGKTIVDFVPSGWFIKDAAFGDLNEDGYRDIAMVVQCGDTSNILHNDGMGSSIIDTNRRILLILMVDSKTELYQLHTQSNTFILNRNDPTQDDPYDELKIENGVLNIHFHIWYSAGSWWEGTNKYKYKYKDSTFFLIGADVYRRHRGNGESSMESYNFLTRKKQVIEWNEAEDYLSKENGSKPPQKEEYWVTIKQKQLKTFQTFQAPFTWSEDNVEL